ncbi:antitoxin VbhA family protein [Mycolicibacterium sp.]|uniref:antitoxin VbhA family protein n=1 Tax=Mycolicibacterium sp. TaxID=2320850 RepID=UPI0037C6CFFC
MSAIPEHDAREAIAVTEAALALSGHELHPYTSELMEQMDSGDITADEAVEAIIARFVGTSQTA